MFLFKKQPSINLKEYRGAISAASTQPVVLSKDFETGKTQPTSLLPENLSYLCCTQIDNLYVSSQGFTGIKTQTDDAVNSGFVISSTGKVLPYIAGADGAFGCLSLASTLICNDFFPSIVSKYVEKLSNSSGEHNDIEKIMKELLMEINEEANRLGSIYSETGTEVCFTFACAISFEKDNVTRVASIGIGSDLIAIYRPANEHDGGYIRLYDAAGVVEHGRESAEKIFLPLSSPYSNIKNEKVTVAEYFNDIVVTNSLLLAGDILVFLTDGIHSELTTIEENITRNHNVMRYLSIQPNEVSPEQLFKKAIESIKYKTRTSDQPWAFGDDAAIGIVKVPTIDESRQIIDYAKSTLAEAKKSIIPVLAAVKWSLVSTMFSHNNRIKAVLAALENSRNIYELYAILENQRQLFQSGTTINLDSSLLEKRYSSEVKKLENHDNSSSLPSASQNYLYAIESAKTSLEEFCSKLPLHHCGKKLDSEYDNETNMSKSVATVEELSEQANSVETSTSLQPRNK